MKKGFFTSSTFGLFVAFSIALGIFLMPVSTKIATLTQYTSKVYAQANTVTNVSSTVDTPSSTSTPIWTWVKGKLSTAADNTAGVALFIPLKATGMFLIITRATIGLGTALSGHLIDYTITTSIGINYDTSVQGIVTVWKLTRDIINVSLIFLLLYAGIMQIIGLAKANTKQIIIGVVTVGLLINFSLFFTRVLVDASNMVSTALYNQVVDIGNATNGSTSFSSAIMNGANISSLIYQPIGKIFTTGSFSSMTSLNTTLTAQIVVLIVMAWAFLSVAFLFLGRIVMIIILMALAPIGFIGLSIGSVAPSLKKMSAWWWRELINQLLVAPVFLLFSIIILSVCSGAGKSVFDSNLLDISQLWGGDFSSYLILGILLFLLIKSVKITKTMSGAVGSFADGLIAKLGDVLVTAVLAAVTGGASAALRGTIGMAASETLSGKNAAGLALKETARKGGISGAFANIARSGLRGVTQSSFDVRATKTGQTMQKGMGISWGTPQKGGYEGYMKKAEEAAVKNAEALSKLSEAEKAEVKIRLEKEKVETPAKIEELKREEKVKDLDIKKIDELIKTMKENEKEKPTRDANGVIIQNPDIERRIEERKRKESEMAEIVRKRKEAEKRSEALGLEGNEEIKKETIEKAEKEKINENMKEYAKVVEEKTILPLFANKGALADAIRKKTKEKSTGEQIEEAINKKAEAKEKEEKSSESSKPATPPPSPEAKTT